MRKFFKWLGLGVLALILLLAVYPWFPVFQDSFGSSERVRYLAFNKTEFDLEGQPDALRLPPEFAEAKFIMLTEMHGYGAMQQVDLTLLRAVNEQLNVRSYIAEITPAEAIVFNGYVAGGSDTSVREVLDRWAEKSLQYAAQEYFDKLTAIRAWNEGRPEGQKVLFIGIDQETNREWARRVLEIPREDALPGFGNIAAVQSLNASLASQGLDTKISPSRYTAMIPAIETILATPGGQDETFYGLWGIFHGAKVDINGSTTLAKRLSEDNGIFGDKLLTINSLCIENCFNLMPAVALPAQLAGSDGEKYTALPMSVDHTYISRIRGLSDLREAMPEGADAALFRLDGENSPYMDGPRLINQSGYLNAANPFVFEGGAGQAHDFLIAFRNSPALTPWDGKTYDMSGEALPPMKVR